MLPDALSIESPLSSAPGIVNDAYSSPVLRRMVTVEVAAPSVAVLVWVIIVIAEICVNSIH